MKHLVEIKDQRTGVVITTQEVEAAEDDCPNLLLGLAAEQAVKAKVDLSYTNLSSANLSVAKGLKKTSRKI
jgi:hypothetical protein